MGNAAKRARVSRPTQPFAVLGLPSQCRPIRAPPELLLSSFFQPRSVLPRSRPATSMILNFPPGRPGLPACFLCTPHHILKVFTRKNSEALCGGSRGYTGFSIWFISGHPADEVDVLWMCCGCKVGTAPNF